MLRQAANNIYNAHYGVASYAEVYNVKNNYKKLKRK